MQCRSSACSVLPGRPAAGFKSTTTLRLAQRTFRLVTEQLVATESGIRVPQGKTLDTDRTNTKRWAQVSRNRARNHTHSHSHRHKEPSLVRPRAVQGQPRDLSRVQLPSRRRDCYHANHYPRHASRRRSKCHHHHASHRYHRHVRRRGDQRMKAEPKIPVTQSPQLELLNVLSFSFSGYALPRERVGLPPNSVLSCPRTDDGCDGCSGTGLGEPLVISFGATVDDLGRGLGPSKRAQNSLGGIIYGCEAVRSG
jgi:hypothetical protein